MTDTTFARSSVARAFAAKAQARAEQVRNDWVARVQDMVPNAELVPALGAAAVMMLCLTQIF